MPSVKTGLIERLFIACGKERKCPTCHWATSYTRQTNGPLWECCVHPDKVSYVGQGYFICGGYERRELNESKETLQPTQ